MAARNGYAPDWRDAAAYEPLLDADRSLFAWEWLRRNRSYRTAAERALQAFVADSPNECGDAPGRWGLHAFEGPGVTVPEARPVWGSEVHPFVLPVHAVPSGGEDAFDLERFDALWRLVVAADAREHLLISDGIRTIRIDVLSGSMRDGPARLHYLLSGFAGTEWPLVTLRRLLTLWRTGRFSAALHPSEARAGRLVLMLRVHDALASGATQREIAAQLLSGDARQDRWRVTAPSVRSRAQRLVRNARAMASGGYLALLRG